MYVDAHTYMVDDILTKVDRMSMAVSLEAREPLLDHKLLEFAARVPAVAQAEGRPRQVPAAPGARAASAARRSSSAASSGFAAPIGEWLRGPLAPMADELLLDGRLRDRGIFNDREVTRALDASTATGRADHRHRLWQLMMLELWFRQFIDDAGGRRAPRAAAALQRR